MRTLAVALALLSLVSVAEAQNRGGRGGGVGGFGRGGNARFLAQPEYLRRDLPIFVDQLRLDTTQKVIVETLLMDYQSSFEDAYEQVRADLEALRPQRTPEEEEFRRTQWQEMGDLRAEMREVRDTIEQLSSREDIDPTVVTRLEQRLEGLGVEMTERRETMVDEDGRRAREDAASAINDEWAGRRKAMGVEFMLSVQALLNDSQIQQWPIFERNLRRMKTMALGEYAGENVDLFILIKQLGVIPDAVPDLNESLESYAYTLDSALSARNKHLEEHRDTARQAARAGDFKQAESVTAREADLRSRVRDVNQEHARIIATVLGAEEQGGEFSSEFNLRAFPRVYRPTRMQRAFEAAQKLEGLTAEVMEAVLNLEQAYLVELGITNDKIVRTTRKEEPKQQVDRIKRQAERAASGEGGRGRGGRGNDGAEDPIRAAYFERDQLDYRYWQQLEAILTPEQIAQLPEVREPSERRRRGGGNFEERLAEVDANGDGKLQKSEAPEWMLNFFDRLDANGDGTVDEKEMEDIRNRFRRGRGGDGAGRGGDGGGGRGGGRGGGGRGGGGRGGRGGDA